MFTVISIFLCLEIRTYQLIKQNMEYVDFFPHNIGARHENIGWNVDNNVTLSAY